MLLTKLAPNSFNGFSLNGRTQNYETQGYLQAQKCHGNYLAIQNCLQALYAGFAEKVRRDWQRQNSLKQPYIEKVKRLERDNNELEKVIARKQSKDIPRLQQAIDNLRTEIIKIRQDPEAYVLKKVDKSSYYIGYAILFFLTIYLIIFYSSASYSALFRVYQPGVNIREAILDPNTFVKAYFDGPGELLFIVLMPSIFLALGYLIHKFIEQKNVLNYLKVTLLLGVTFMFDAFLAYKISESIHMVNGGLFTEEYTIVKAVHDIDCWVVIFAGFVAYIVWGLVFDFTMRAQQNLDQIGALVKGRLQRIKQIENRIAREESYTEKHQKRIDDNARKIAHNEQTLAGTIINFDDIRKIHFEFITGWKRFMIESKMSSNELEQAEHIASCCLGKKKLQLSQNTY